MSGDRREMPMHENGPEARLLALGLTLPAPPPAAGRYVTSVEANGFLFIAGQGPLKADGRYATGKLGVDVGIEEARGNARLCALLVLATARAALGSLDRVERVVKVHGMVNASPDFSDHPQVINGFSDVMIDVFGDAGWHARAAVGHIGLPGNMTVEVETIFQVTAA